MISIVIDVPTIGGACSSRQYYIRMERYLACIARAMAHWLSIVDLAGLRCATCAITNALYVAIANNDRNRTVIRSHEDRPF